MIDDIDIDKECRTLILIETATEFTICDNVVWFNRSGPWWTVLEGIDVDI
jgi:hypothetical protein